MCSSISALVSIPVRLCVVSYEHLDKPSCSGNLDADGLLKPHGKPAFGASDSLCFLLLVSWLVWYALPARNSDSLQWNLGHGLITLTAFPWDASTTCKCFRQTCLIAEPRAIAKSLRTSSGFAPKLRSLSLLCISSFACCLLD